MTIDQRELDELWDFDDPVASEAAFRRAVSSTTDPMARAVLASQVARALGLQGRYDDADAELNRLDAAVPAVRARSDLERGRLRNSAGHPEHAVGLFESAATAAAAVGDPFLLVDALHMLGIVQPELGDVHLAAAMAVLDADPPPDRRTQRWRVALHNNRGWALFDAGDLSPALREFEQALRDAESYGTEQQQEWAREAIRECRETLDATSLEAAALDDRTPPS